MSYEDRWLSFPEMIEKREGAVRKCSWCDQDKKGLYWGGDWVCGKCMDESTIEGIIVDDRIVPRFSQEYQKLQKEMMKKYEDAIDKV